MLSNFHTHCSFCDGKGHPRQYVEQALALGFSSLGFSSHAPLPFPTSFAVRQERYKEYCDTVRALADEYKDKITILLGLEIDYVPKVQEDFAQLVASGGLDYVIGSVHLVPNTEHFVPDGDINSQLWFIDGPLQERYDKGLADIFGGDIRRAVTAYFRQYNAMLETNKPTIAGHFDKIVMHNRERYFHYNDSWFMSLIDETIDLIAQLGIICEVNTRGIYKGRHTDFYPARQTLRRMSNLAIPVIVSTDAHCPEDIGLFCGAYEFLADIGYSTIVDTPTLP